VPHDREICVDVLLRANDVYRPFRLSSKNVLMWTAALLFCGLVYDVAFSPVRVVHTDRGKLFCALLGFAALAAAFVLPYFRMRSNLRRTPAFQSPVHYRITPQGILSESEHGRGELKWSAFIRIVETPSSFLLYRTTRLATYLPKRCFTTTNDILQVRSLISANYRGKWHHR
jgi:hypothetical protein